VLAVLLFIGDCPVPTWRCSYAPEVSYLGHSGSASTWSVGRRTRAIRVFRTAAWVDRSMRSGELTHLAPNPVGSADERSSTPGARTRLPPTPARLMHLFFCAPSGPPRRGPLWPAVALGQASPPCGTLRGGGFLRALQGARRLGIARGISGYAHREQVIG